MVAVDVVVVVVEVVVVVAMVVGDSLVGDVEEDWNSVDKVVVVVVVVVASLAWSMDHRQQQWLQQEEKAVDLQPS